MPVAMLCDGCCFHQPAPVPGRTALGMLGAGGPRGHGCPGPSGAQALLGWAHCAVSCMLSGPYQMLTKPICSIPDTSWKPVALTKTLTLSPLQTESGNLVSALPSVAQPGLGHR